MTGPEPAVTRVAVLGPGRLGTTLALALPSPAYEITAVAGRGDASLEAFVARVPTARIAADPSDATAPADLVLVCVPDDALESIVRQVARDDGVAPASRWVHVAGGHGIAPLRPAQLAGARVAACHPAQTFPDPDTGLQHLREAAWAVTAAASDLAWARLLVEDLGGRPQPVAEASRVLYHAALTIGSNATAAVVALARDLLLAAGVEDPAGFLEPIATVSAQGAARRGAAALTGPVRRGDGGTVAAHLGELEVALPEAADAYRALARLTLSYARRAGLDAPEAAVIAAILDARDPGDDDG